jgi:pyridinium-3,5-bisthiocarboxylic acid mononucleotide nickel chelatase
MILYLDCIGGIAGDMLMAALIDAGASVEAINSELQKLRIPNLAVSTKRTTKHGINCCHVRVMWGEGQSEPSEHSGAKAQPGNRNESSDHLSDHTSHHEGSDDEHPHRPYSAIRDLLGSAGFSPAVTARAQAVFRKLAEAEGSVHGIAADDVHFHEVGSEDAIADVVGVALALEQLGVEEIVVSPLPIGRGFVRSAHGVLPLPAPATLELLRGIPVQGVDIDRELVTPTGAAIVAALGTGFGGFPSMTTTSIGYGAGTRDLAERPNVVRAVLGMRSSVTPVATVVVIETNLDDCSPELIPDAALAATKAGALDVWVTPATMKKGRPGFVLHALARPDRQAEVAAAILRETSALGVRISHCERIELDRSFFSVDVDGQSINIKVGSQNGAVVNVAPEHDDCAAAAAKLALPVKEVFARALTSASAHLRNAQTPL